jgi:hypothetical protein
MTLRVCINPVLEPQLRKAFVAGLKISIACDDEEILGLSECTSSIDMSSVSNLNFSTGPELDELRRLERRYHSKDDPKD